MDEIHPYRNNISINSNNPSITLVSTRLGSIQSINGLINMTLAT